MVNPKKGLRQTGFFSDQFIENYRKISGKLEEKIKNQSGDILYDYLV